MRRVLVTGGAGFIGRVLVRDLLAEGRAVTVLDDLSTGAADALPDAARLIVGDVCDRRAVDEALQGADAVVHLAARLIVDESFEQPDRYMATNAGGTRVLLDGMAAAGCSRLIFSSTAAVYGDAGGAPIPEDTPVRPASPYGESKLRADEVIASRAGNRLRAVSLRYFNVAGATGSLGESRERETHLIPIALDVAAGARRVLHVFGTDYPTPDGTPIRDYVHVEDISRAHIAALEQMPTGHRIYNVGSGEGHSVFDVITCVERVTGCPVPWELRPRRRGDPAVLVASSQRLRAELGWRPAASDLGRIVEDAWRWRRSSVAASAGD